MDLSSYQNESNRKSNILRLAEETVLVLVLLAGLMGVIAPKSIVGLVVFAGIAGFVAWLSSSRPKIPFPHSLTLTVGILIAWAAISSFWSMSEVKAIALSFRLAGLCLAGLFMLHVIVECSTAVRERLKTNLLVAYCLGLFALATGYFYAEYTNTSLWSSYYYDPLTTLNNGAVIMALLLWPVTVIVWERMGPIAGILLVPIVISELLFLSSGASILSISVGLIAFILVLFFGRRMVLGIGVVIAGLFLVAPALTGSVPQSETSKNFIAKMPPSVDHRLKMWNFVSAKIDEKPFFGWGMDSSRHLPQDAFRLAPNMEIMPLHPHNAALQIRLELGWPGTIIGAALIFALFRSIQRSHSPRITMAINVSTTTAYLSVGAVSYGVWQNWWIAIAWLLTVAATIALPRKNAYSNLH